MHRIIKTLKIQARLIALVSLSVSASLTIIYSVAMADTYLKPAITGGSGLHVDGTATINMGLGASISDDALVVEKGNLLINNGNIGIECYGDDQQAANIENCILPISQ